MKSIYDEIHNFNYRGDLWDKIGHNLEYDIRNYLFYSILNNLWDDLLDRIVKNLRNEKYIYRNK